MMRYRTNRVVAIALALIPSISGNSLAMNATPGPHQTRSPVPGTAWSRLWIGVRAYLSADGDADGKSQTICKTERIYEQYFNTDKKPICVHEPAGSLVIVRAIFPQTSVDGKPQWPNVNVQAADGSWSGFTQAARLLPVIPPGAVLVIVDESQGPHHPHLYAAPGDKNGVAMPDGTRVRVSTYDPQVSGGAYVFVQVLDGSHEGARGWILASDAIPEDGRKDGITVDMLDYALKP